jgi:hypothetical protein
MKTSEIIFIPEVDNDVYKSLVHKCFRYALISVAFTYNRMSKTDIKTRVQNIFKGKLAENIFLDWTNKKGLHLDFNSCATPFWEPDLRDFVFLGGEWDIKNNYITCSLENFRQLQAKDLSALIPDKGDYDQWAKRNLLLLPFTRFSAYVFSFMRIEPGQRNFSNILLSDEQWKWIESMAEKYQNTAVSEMPFFEQHFFNQLLDENTPLSIKIDYQPQMIITGCANPKYWSLFTPLPPNTVIGKGLIKTIIPNQGCSIDRLPSFESVLSKIKS